MAMRKTITFPKRLHDSIKKLAESENRSFTKQVICLLEKTISNKIKVVVITEDRDAD